MAAHAGERAEKTGTFHCRDCDASVRVRKGQKIPPCPCGGTECESRTHEAGTRTGRGTRARGKRTVQTRGRRASTRKSSGRKRAA